VLRNVRALVDLTSDLHARYDDVLALCPNAYLSRLRVCGSLREGGGAFERPYLGLWVFGADGLIVRWEQFDVGREVDALARFDELAGEVAEPATIPSVSPFGKRKSEERSEHEVEGTAVRIPPNAATWTHDRSLEYTERGDWNALRALAAPVVFED